MHIQCDSWNHQKDVTVVCFFFRKYITYIMNTYWKNTMTLKRELTCVHVLHDILNNYGWNWTIAQLKFMLYHQNTNLHGKIESIAIQMPDNRTSEVMNSDEPCNQYYLPYGKIAPGLICHRHGCCQWTMAQKMNVFTVFMKCVLTSGKKQNCQTIIFY